MSESAPINGKAKPKRCPAEHLKQWRFKPGEVHNPGGRPKGARPFSHYLAKIACEHVDKDDLKSPTRMEHLARIVWQKAEEGQRKPLELLLERLDPVARVELSAKVQTTSEEMVQLIARINARLLPPRDDDGRPIIDATDDQVDMIDAQALPSLPVEHDGEQASEADDEDQLRDMTQ